MSRKMRLTKSGIARLKPGEHDYTVWDTITPGLGVRVRKSGFRGFVFHRRGAGQARRVSLGPVTLKSVAEARRECLSIQLDETAAYAGTKSVSGSSIPLFRDYVRKFMEGRPWRTLETVDKKNRG